MVFGGEVSEWSDVRTGVPRGSILGPHLFPICVNDSPAVLFRSTVMMYMDDTTVYISNSTTTTVQEVLNELGRLSSWIASNGLRLNVKKTQVMIMLGRVSRKKLRGCSFPLTMMR